MRVEKTLMVRRTGITIVGKFSRIDRQMSIATGETRLASNGWLDASNKQSALNGVTTDIKRPLESNQCESETVITEQKKKRLQSRSGRKRDCNHGAEGEETIITDHG